MTILAAPLCKDSNDYQVPCPDAVVKRMQQHLAQAAFVIAQSPYHVSPQYTIARNYAGEMRFILNVLFPEEEDSRDI